MNHKGIVVNTKTMKVEEFFLSDWGVVAQFATEVGVLESLPSDVSKLAQQVYALAMSNIKDEREKQYFEEMFR